MGTTVDKFEAAFETKDLIKSGINRLGGSLTSESTFRNYATELENLYDEMPKVTGEGSNVSLSPTRKGGLSITPLGKCEQDTTTGKNVLNNTLQSGTINSLTYTINADKSITLNGTASAFSILTIPITENLSGYYLSGGSQISANVYLRATYSDNTSTNVLDSTPVALENKTLASVTLRINNGVQFNNVTIYPMIANTSNTDYEPYTR